MLLISATDASSQSYVCGARSCRELAALGLFGTMVDPPSHEPQLRCHCGGAPICVLGLGVFGTLDRHTVLLLFLLADLGVIKSSALTWEPCISYY